MNSFLGISSQRSKIYSRVSSETTGFNSLVVATGGNPKFEVSMEQQPKLELLRTNAR